VRSQQLTAYSLQLTVSSQGNEGRAHCKLSAVSCRLSAFPLTMANSKKREKNGAANSVLSRSAAGRHGVTFTFGVSPAQLSLFSGAQVRRQRPLSEAWSEFWETDPPVFPLRLGRGASWPKVRRFAPAFLTSSLIHFSVLLFLWSIPFAVILSRFMGPPLGRTSSHPHMVVYEFRHLSLPDYLPAIHPPGQGKAPGRGAKNGRRPRLGSSHYDPRITIISNPPHPDNFRLTLMTENAPPDLKLPKDLKIPDLITGGPAPAPEAAKSSSSTPEKVANPTPEKPNVAPPPKSPETQSMAPTLKPAVPTPPPPPTLKLAMQLPDIPSPRLEVPPPPRPVKETAPPVAEAAPAPLQPAPQATAHPTTEASPAPPPNNPSATAAASDTPKPGGGPKIMALSVDPVPLKDAIPAGEHAGAFSISPAGSVRGSPGGVRGAPPDVGEGGHGLGGDKSVAVGNGSGKPGGGGLGSSASSPSASPTVSVSGIAGSTGISAGTLAPLKGEDLVYAVKPETPKARAPSLVVSSGSWGGGGLRIFGVLHGDKIYTVYFSMPGKNWILQYCAHENSTQVDAASRVVQIHIQPPLAPPAAIEQFDFHRLTEQPDSAHTIIILHGIIHEDGLVSDLAVLQGLDPTTNAAACAAFSRWKFKPALRAGTPVAVEILVGIP